MMIQSNNLLSSKAFITDESLKQRLSVVHFNGIFIRQPIRLKHFKVFCAPKLTNQIAEIDQILSGGDLR